MNSLEVALNVEVESEKLEPKEYESSSKIDRHEILFNAIVKKSLTIVEALLKMEDWNLDATNLVGETALLVAFINDRMDIVDLLLKYEAKIEETLVVAIKKGLIEIVEKILTFDIDMYMVQKVANQSPINFAIQINNLKTVKILLKHNFDVNHETFIGSLPLQVAVSTENIEIIKELLKNGAKPDVYDENEMTPLMNALGIDRFDIAEILLENGADIDSRSLFGLTALHHAAKNGKVNVVNFLLKNNANIDCVDSHKSTPLDVANGLPEVVKILLLKGANSNLISYIGCTPFANSSNKMRIYYFDYATNLNLNVRNSKGYTPFEDDLRYNDISSAKMIFYYLNL